MILNRCTTEGILRVVIHRTVDAQRAAAIARYQAHTAKCPTCQGWLAKQRECAEEWQYPPDMDEQLAAWAAEREAASISQPAEVAGR